FPVARVAAMKTEQTPERDAHQAPHRDSGGRVRVPTNRITLIAKTAAIRTTAIGTSRRYDPKESRTMKRIIASMAAPRGVMGDLQCEGSSDAVRRDGARRSPRVGQYRE